jgi:hypothetical protein
MGPLRFVRVSDIAVLPAPGLIAPGLKPWMPSVSPALRVTVVWKLVDADGLVT